MVGMRCQAAALLFAALLLVHELSGTSEVAEAAGVHREELSIASRRSLKGAAPGSKQFHVASSAAVGARQQQGRPGPPPQLLLGNYKLFLRGPAFCVQNTSSPLPEGGYYLSGRPCRRNQKGNGVPMLHTVDDGSGLGVQTFLVLPANLSSGDGILGVPATLMNLGRASCGDHLVPAGPQQCHQAKLGMGGALTPGALQWVLEYAEEPETVFIMTQARPRRCQVRYLGALVQDCTAPKLRLFRKTDARALLKWKLQQALQTDMPQPLPV